MAQAQIMGVNTTFLLMTEDFDRLTLRRELHQIRIPPIPLLPFLSRLFSILLFKANPVLWRPAGWNWSLEIAVSWAP